MSQRLLPSHREGSIMRSLVYLQFGSIYKLHSVRRGGDWGTVGCGRVCGDGPLQRHRPDPALQCVMPIWIKRSTCSFLFLQMNLHFCSV